MKEPPVFNGDKAAYREWKRKLTMWVSDEKNKIRSDSERINIALSYMDGEKVRDWIENFYDSNWLIGAGRWLDTWVEFVERLDKTYLDTARHADARVKFEKVRQGRDETAAAFF